MMAAQYSNGRCVRQPNVSFPCGAADKNDTAQRGNRLNDSVEVDKAKFHVTCAGSANASTVNVT
jgi:hypothetical protein